MGVVHIPEPEHKCDPPFGVDGNPLLPTLPRKSLWRCDECGCLLQVWGASYVGASLVDRWCYRKVR